MRPYRPNISFLSLLLRKYESTLSLHCSGMKRNNAGRSGMEDPGSAKSRKNGGINQRYVRDPISDDVGRQADESERKERRRLTAHEFDKSGEELAKYLLGKVVVRRLTDGTILSGRIVETEAYLGHIDKACHSYGGKKTDRTEPMHMPPGTAYVYFIYGMYHCLNVSSADQGGCVLIRALEAEKGIEQMQAFRAAKRKGTSPKVIPMKALCNGPSKLCTAMQITKDELNKTNMVNSSIFWFEEDESNNPQPIITSTRIGIDSYGLEWAQKPLRFYLLNSSSVSVRDKKAEQLAH